MAMKTVKELATELKVTPQYINRIIQQIPSTKKPKQVSHSYKIDSISEAAIKEYMSVRHTSKTTKQQNNKSLNVSLLQKKLTAQLEKENASLKRQIETKDKQIEKLLKQNEQIQKLVDQEQQLHLADQKRIDQLEQPGEKNKNEAQQNNETDNQQEERPKKGLFKRLFGSS